YGGEKYTITTGSLSDQRSYTASTNLSENSLSSINSSFNISCVVSSTILSSLSPNSNFTFSYNSSYVKTLASQGNFLYSRFINAQNLSYCVLISFTVD